MQHKRLKHWQKYVCCALAAFGLWLVVDAWHAAQLGQFSPTWLVTDRNGRFLGEVVNGSAASPAHGYGYWQPPEDIWPRVEAATLALEDKRFYHHAGVDIRAIARALYQNITNTRRISGASTIAMQVVRLQNPRPRTYFNKLREALAAVILTTRVGKKAVLRHYLSIVPYGNRIHGIAYAAERYFNKPVADLSWAELAFLCALPQSPTQMNPFRARGFAKAQGRAEFLLGVLHKAGTLPKSDYENAQKQLPYLRFPAYVPRPPEAIHFLFEIARNAPAHGKGGRLVTTLDLPLQQQIFDKAQTTIGTWRKDGAEQLAAVVVSRKSLKVRAWLGSADYFDTDFHGAIDFVNVPRSTGSTLKPFIYALALQNGVIETNTVLDDLPAVAGATTNADSRYLGPMLPRFSLANSRNVPAVDVLARTGFDTVYNLLYDTGLHSWRHTGTHYGYSLAVGGLPARLHNLVAAYGTLANDGLYRPLLMFSGQKPAKQIPVLSTQSARLVQQFLSDPAARLPTFPRMGSAEYAFPVALKTGTSQGYRDAWTVAWTSDYIVGVWTGTADMQPTRKLGGAASAAVFAKDILQHLHNTIRPANFAPPEGYKKQTLCRLNGLADGGHCPKLYDEWVKAGKTIAKGRLLVNRKIDKRTGLFATKDTPNKFVAEAVYYNLPPRYSQWAAGHGMAILPVDARQQLALKTGNTNTFIKATPAPKNVHMNITMPRNGMRLFANPAADKAANSLHLQVSVQPEPPEVVWYINNKPYKIAKPPYDVLWPVTQGTHRFQVRLANRPERSAIVQITVE